MIEIILGPRVSSWGRYRSRPVRAIIGPEAIREEEPPLGRGGGKTCCATTPPNKVCILRPRLEIFRDELTLLLSRTSSGPHVDLRCE